MFVIGQIMQCYVILVLMHTFKCKIPYKRFFGFFLVFVLFIRRRGRGWGSCVLWLLSVSVDRPPFFLIPPFHNWWRILPVWFHTHNEGPIMISDQLRVCNKYHLMWRNFETPHPSAQRIGFEIQNIWPEVSLVKQGKLRD